MLPPPTPKMISQQKERWLDAQGTVSSTLAMTNRETKDQRSKGYPQIVYSLPLLSSGLAGGGRLLLQLTHAPAMALQPLAAAAATATCLGVLGKTTD